MHYAKLRYAKRRNSKTSLFWRTGAVSLIDSGFLSCRKFIGMIDIPSNTYFTFQSTSPHYSINFAPQNNLPL